MELEAKVILKADTKELSDAVKELEGLNKIELDGSNLVNARTKRELVKSLNSAFNASAANARRATTVEKNKIYTDPEVGKQYKSVQKFITTNRTNRQKSDRYHRKAVKKIDNDARRESNEINEAHLTNIGYINNYFKSLSSELSRFNYLFKADTDVDKHGRKIEQDIKLANTKAENERDNMLLQADLMLNMFNAVNEGELKQNASLFTQAIFHALQMSSIESDKYEKKREQDIKYANAKAENDRNNMLLQADLMLNMLKSVNEGELNQNAELIKQALFQALQMSAIENDKYQKKIEQDIKLANSKAESDKDTIRERSKTRKEEDDNYAKNRKEINQDRQDKRMEFADYDHKLKMERMSFNAPLSFKDIDNLIGFATGKVDKDNEELGITIDKVKNIAKGLAFGAVTAFVTSTLMTVLKVGKSVVSVFTNIAKQTETFKNMINLILTPISLLFTLLFVPLLIAVLPMVKAMFSWVTENKDAIMAVGEKLGSVFSSDKLGVISKALDGVLYVVDGLANVFTTNASLIDTSSLSEFISSTVLAIANMIQDVLMGVVAFCYSPEGQAFINSVSLAFGKVVGSILTALVALIPVIFQSVHMSITGVIDGIYSFLGKAVIGMIDMVDKFTGGAITGVLTTIVNLINTAINALNSINIFGFQPFNIGTLETPNLSTSGSVVSNTFDQGIVNNFNINNMMNIPNSGAIREVMSTGVY